VEKEIFKKFQKECTTLINSHAHVSLMVKRNRLKCGTIKNLIFVENGVDKKTDEERGKLVGQILELHK